MAWAVWFTGLPGCGKTTVARATEKELAARGVRVRVLELDEIRRALTPEPKYTEEERAIVYAALAYMAKLLADEGVNVIIDATGNLRKYRDNAYVLIANFGEIYIRCPIEVCMAREAGRAAQFTPKGIYRKGKTGQSATVPGLNVPYEPPIRPMLTIDCETPPEEAGKAAAEAILGKFGGAHG
ncbi:MAG TPA: adenylyl-sulfate kinase [Methanocella sp.]|jgi:adenylylsulfate kinase